MMNYESKIIPRSFYATSSDIVAKKLLGQYLVRKLDNNTYIVGKIVEVEAYLSADDPAAHNFVGQTERNKSLFKEEGLTYVHSSRHHFLLDIVTDSVGIPGSVLIRALEPIAGIEKMIEFRGTDKMENLTSGPGKVCQALQINREFDGIDITSTKSPLFICYGEGVDLHTIVEATRVGISKAADLPLRFYVKNNPHVSKS